MQLTSLSLLTILFFGLNQSFAQNLKPKHKPAWQTAEEKTLRNPNAVLLNKFGSNKKLPNNIILPGEFEESKAVAISWSYDFDAQGNPTVIDLNSEYADVSAKLAYEINKEVEVWIRVKIAADTTAILNNMQSRNMHLTKYRFFILPMDDWWTRDYGPMAFYTQNLDSIGFVDMKYYDGRDKDNLFPQYLADAIGVDNYVSQIYAEGGNIMTDGFGQLHFSDVITLVNGESTTHLTPWSKAQTLDTLKYIFNTPDLVELPTLECDGGTGHIDLYTRFIDEQTLMVAQYPDVITAQDKQIIEDNVQKMFKLKSTYNRPFRLARVEHPTNDNGQHTRLTCAKIDEDARNFINGVTVNNTFIFPSYTDGVTGNKAQHARIMEYYKRIMPGYKIVPIDSRYLSPLGGAIHCITIQIPADNPIRFWHPSVDGIQPNIPKFHVVSKIKNTSGIANATCKWRKNNGTWNTITLTDSSGYFIGDITNSGLSGLDSIEYYLEATSNNGKTATKPITANNDGYYKIRLAYASGLNNFVENKNHLFNAYPNPANSYIVLPFKLNQIADATLKVFDINGREVFTKNYNKLTADFYNETVDINNFNSGLYFYSLYINNELVMSKKFIKN